ncbi:BREX-1 system adenine-specific DNA-methyltransferase PglX, partial [Brachybacterium sp. AOP35-5H-19]|uniref:BREX-1 system adenine-specific DNA-methyltransferase PglX n=1 Tax=Brachybacterium sp. AOP35-5H-19 TaxID=3457685 RepID=UPI0040338C91
MDTAPLKSFATWARRELITQVSARLTAVLAPASPERVENQRSVTLLERDIAAAGGGAKGKDAVADKVAYTWFNRIIALRFMDANGYTGIGIVSPAHGQQTGQPEILADAKRGSIDPAVVSNKRTLDTIVGLLDGTRPSPDAQGEAYTLLLAEYCRYWNRSMPFMFEREGDYTELLIPANLLAADSILSRAAAALTEEVCREVEVIGWLYQFYISERKDEVFAGFKKGQKAGAAEIPAATQLFTPHWIVRYLVENSVGRLWMLNHPESRLVDRMDYYIAPVDEETDFLKITSPQELTVIDPACGSGHMLAYTFDLLYTIYEEEGYAPSEIPELILTHNLFGTEIDPRAGSLAAFALGMKARAKQRTFFSERVTPNVYVIEQVSFTTDELDVLAVPNGERYPQDEFWNQFMHADSLGALISPDPDLHKQLLDHVASLNLAPDIFSSNLLERANRVLTQAEALVRGHAIVVANPPYMGSGNMGAALVDFVKTHYVDFKQDLYACFVRRAIDLTSSGGIVGIVTGDTWLSITSFEGLRRALMSFAGLKNMVHIRDAGNLPSKFGANTAYVFSVGRATNRSARAVFVRTSRPGVEAKRQQVLTAMSSRSRATGWYEATPSEFERLPSAPMAYWLGEGLVHAFSENLLAEEFESGGRLKTHNDARFVRFVWEISSSSIGDKWRHLSHGGEFRRWYGNRLRVVRWDNTARQEYASHGGLHNEKYWYRPGITASKITSSINSFRAKDEDQEYSSLAPTVFSTGDERGRTLRTLGLLNSSAVQEVLWALNPSMTLNVGDVLRVPGF